MLCTISSLITITIIIARLMRVLGDEVISYTHTHTHTHTYIYIYTHTHTYIYRVMRVLRPLRLLNKIKSLQLLLLSIQASATDMINVLCLWLFMCLVFSICAINLFAGKLYACNDGDFVGWPLNPDQEEGSNIGWRENCVGTYYTSENESGSAYVADFVETSVLKPRVWANPSDGV
jgi:hypothetical protein